MAETEHVQGTQEPPPEVPTPGRRAATHAAFAMLVAATFAIFLALSFPLSRLGSNLFASGGLLTPKGGPGTSILGLPGLQDLVPGSVPVFGAPGATGAAAPIPPLPGPADVGPPAPGSAVTPPLVTGGAGSTGPVDTTQSKPLWWTTLTPSQQHAVHRHWKQVHIEQHKAQQDDRTHHRRHHAH